jgi:ribonuclease P protein component
MSEKSQTFRKSERLCSKKAIADLFENGRSFYSFPFQIIWVISAGAFSSPAQVAISVSKKTFRNAVTRNLIRRRIREAYRKNKQMLYSFLISGNIQINYIIIFKDSSVPEYVTVEKAIVSALEKLTSDIKNKCEIC